MPSGRPAGRHTSFRWPAHRSATIGASRDAIDYGHAMPPATYKDLCIDAADPHALSAFWGPLLGWEPHPHDDGDSCLRVGDDVKVWLNRVPEPKAVKNRLHLD